MVFTDTVNGDIVWADIELITMQHEDGSFYRVARPIAIDIPKLLPMTAFLTDFEEGMKLQDISVEVAWEKLKLIEVQIKPKGLIISLNQRN